MDDPRTFQESGPPLDGGAAPGGGPGLENFISTPNSMPSYQQSYIVFSQIYFNISTNNLAPSMDPSVEIQTSRPLPTGQAQYVFMPLAHPILMCCSGRSWFPIRHRSRSGRFPDNFNWWATIAWWKSARVRKDVNVIGTAS